MVLLALSLPGSRTAKDKKLFNRVSNGRVKGHRYGWTGDGSQCSPHHIVHITSLTRVWGPASGKKHLILVLAVVEISID